MESKLPIVPVLVDGASMPTESSLPPSFANLSKLNAIDLRHASFERDMQAVSEELADILGGAKATAIEGSEAVRPFFKNSIARIYGGIVLFSALGALWGLIELAAAGFAVHQGGLRSLFTPSLLIGSATTPINVDRGIRRLRFWFYRAQVDPLVASRDDQYGSRWQKSSLPRCSPSVM